MAALAGCATLRDGNRAASGPGPGPSADAHAGAQGLVTRSVATNEPGSRDSPYTGAGRIPSSRTA
jgi:hypothetical protein